MEDLAEDLAEDFEKAAAGLEPEHAESLRSLRKTVEELTIGTDLKSMIAALGRCGWSVEGALDWILDEQREGQANL